MFHRPICQSPRSLSSLKATSSLFDKGFHLSHEDCYADILLRFLAPLINSDQFLWHLYIIIIRPEDFPGPTACSTFEPMGCNLTKVFHDDQSSRGFPHNIDAEWYVLPHAQAAADVGWQKAVSAKPLCLSCKRCPEATNGHEWICHDSSTKLNCRLVFQIN